MLSHYRCKHCRRIFALDPSVPSEDLVSKEEAVAVVLAGTPDPDYVCFDCQKLSIGEDSFLVGGGDL